MKVSEITVKDITNYLRLSEVSNEDNKNIELFLNIAKNYIENYTGIPQKSDNEEEETLDTYSDFIIVVYVLCQDMYDNRVMYVDGKNINNTVKTILDMHTRNNL
nr:MAG TPA: head tail connector [Caudoviricetes sp.]